MSTALSVCIVLVKNHMRSKISISCCRHICQLHWPHMPVTHNEDIVNELDDVLIHQLESSTINNSVDLDVSDLDSPSGCDVSLHHVKLSAVEGKRSRYTPLQPCPVVVTVHVDEQPVRVLIDTGSLADCMSLMLAEQLCVVLTIGETTDHPVGGLRAQDPK